VQIIGPALDGIAFAGIHDSEGRLWVGDAVWDHRSLNEKGDPPDVLRALSHRYWDRNIKISEGARLACLTLSPMTRASNATTNCLENLMIFKTLELGQSQSIRSLYIGVTSPSR
jgi:hypothetical protein